MKKLLIFFAAAAALRGQLPNSYPPLPVPSQAKPVAPAKPSAQTPAAPRAAAPKALAPFSPKDLKFPPLRPIPLPAMETFTLANGIKVYLLEDHDLPVITGTAMVRTGYLFDPPEKIGLASLTGTVMRTGGTKGKTGAQLDQQLENIAANVEASIGATSGTVTFFSLRENMPEVMEAFRDVLVAPEFSQEKIDMAKAQVNYTISRRNDDPRALAQREFVETVYGKATPSAQRVESATLGRILRSDLQAFHSRYFFPANVMLAIQGDFSANEMKSRLEALFSSWTEKQPPVPQFPAVAGQSAAGIFVAEKKDAQQTFFALGHLAGQLNDKDYPVLLIAINILGGSSHSRLYKRLRTNMGTASDISATWAADFDQPGLFRISGAARSSFPETLKAIFEELDQVRRGEITDDELRAARDAVLNSLVQSFDTKAKMLNRLVTYEYYGYPKDFVEQMQKAFAAVTKADVQRVLRDHIDPQRFTIVAAGSPVDFGAGLETLGKPVTKIDLTVSQPKVEVTRTDENSLAKGKRILERAQAAVGGAEKLAAIKDAMQLADYKVAPAAGGMQVTETDRWIAPSYFRQESQIPKQGKIVAFFDGKTGRIGTPNGSGALLGPQLKQVRGDLFRLFIPLLLSDRIEGRTVNAVDDDTVEISDTTGNIVRVVFNPETGMPVRMFYESIPAIGPPVAVNETFLEFKEVAGIKIPHSFTLFQSGQKFADVTVIDFQVNKGLKVEDLQKLQ